MVFHKNPLLVEGWQLYFSEVKILKIYQIFLVALGFALLLFWPKRVLVDFLSFSTPPSTYHLMVVASFILCGYLSIRFGLQAYGRYQLHSLSSWLELTPLGPWTIVTGKAALSLVHSLFLCLLTVPFLYAAASPSGVPPSGVLRSVLVLFVCMASYRIIGLFLLTLIEDRTFLSSLIMWAIILTIGLLGLYLFPRANPVLGMLQAATLDMGGIPAAGNLSLDAAATLKLHGILSVIAVTASLAWLYVKKMLIGRKESSH